jgi:hypothetical protein
MPYFRAESACVPPCRGGALPAELIARELPKPSIGLSVIVWVAGRWCPTDRVGSRAGGELTRSLVVDHFGLTDIGFVARRRPRISGVTG